MNKVADVSAVLLLLLVAGCTDINGTRVIERDETYCQMDSSEARSKFILQCIKNANPQSDEEPEDWILKCQDMAEETLCPVILMQITQVCGEGARCRWSEVSRKPKALNDK